MFLPVAVFPGPDWRNSPMVVLSYAAYLRNVDHGHFEAQFKRVFDKIKTTLGQAGATFDDIVTMSVFLTDLRYIPEFNKLSKEIFKKGFPAVTFVEVSHLARPQLIAEIQPIAVIP
jgi:enamine deaminase RidA (YjgF/YER057c/UK114 family)